MGPHGATGVRLAAAGDADGILAIYAPIVRDTAISFEVEPPTVEQMRDRIRATSADYPWLVAEGAISAAEDGGGSNTAQDAGSRGIVGYAYAGRHGERAAYQWSVDVSVYVASASRRSGVARRLYLSLLGILEDLGYYSAFAGIALPNAASVAFHESLGFRAIGVYRRVGYKLGAWRDVGWWQRQLREYRDEPEPPLSMRDYLGAAGLPDRLSGQGPPR
jgi:phosphinothricin acetyltransferase